MLIMFITVFVAMVSYPSVQLELLHIAHDAHHIYDSIGDNGQLPIYIIRIIT